MTVTPTQFRTDLTAFANATQFPDTAVQMYLDDAYLMLPAARWGTMLDRGAEYFAAHFLALDDQADKIAANGGTPGLGVGPLTAKSIGPLSKSYDTKLGIDPNAGHWAQTMYGRRLWQWIRLFGMGGAAVQPAMPCTPDNGPAWPGPPAAVWQT